MAKFEINGVELDFDILEADSADLFEMANDKVLKAQTEAGNAKTLGDGIRVVCNAVFTFIDDLFGEGAHKEVFGESVNMRDCVMAYKTICDKVSEDSSDFQEMFSAKNREQRMNIIKRK